MTTGNDPVAAEDVVSEHIADLWSRMANAEDVARMIDTLAAALDPFPSIPLGEVLVSQLSVAMDLPA